MFSSSSAGDAVRGAFDSDERLVYLNSANQSICPRVVREALDRYHFEYERNPTAGLQAAWGRLWEVQGRLAEFLGADRDDLFLRTNVTSVLNTFLLGAELPPESEILVGELEYGAIVNICRLRAQRDGHHLRVLKLPTTVASLRSLTRTALIDRVLSQLGPRTRMVLLSHVLGGTGLVMPIEEIAAETRRRGILFVVDGAYAPGALPVEMSRLADVDFYGCSLYKWMLGPKGTAFGWVSPRQKERLVPINAGWSTFEAFGPFSEFGGGSRFQSTFLMTGCHDFAPFYAVNETLDFWRTWDRESLMARMRELQSFLDEEITRQLGWRRLASLDRKLQGPLLAYRLPHALQAEGRTLMARALSKGVQLNQVELAGQWHAVLSPHIYNTRKELGLAVSRLRELSQT